MPCMRAFSRLILLATFFLTFLFSPYQSFALEEFDTTLTTNYVVDQVGITRVKHQFSITNKTATKFIKEYSLATAYPNLTSFRITENGQQLQPQISTRGNLTTININFPQDLVGEGKVRRFEVEYVNPDLALISGKVLEIHIPQLSDPNLYDKQTVVITTPEIYGKPIRTNPQPSLILTAQNTIQTRFENLQGSPVSIHFGNTQYYKLQLKYNLENTTGNIAFTQIALPPDTAYQKLHYYSLDPLPKDMKLDDDGNWIATYELRPNSSTPVILSAAVMLSLDSQPYQAPIPKSQHTNKDTFWEVSDKRIAEKANELRTPEKIYQYVVDTLTYDTEAELETTERLGAVKALAQPAKALSQEFTDLFVAIARAAQLPSRRVTGYAYTQNSELRPVGTGTNLLHAWPEYYDPEKEFWVPVDPTWGNTTGGVDYFHQFDLNHIVFAINGVSSVTPYPAGTYRVGNSQAKDIEASLADDFPEVNPDFSLAAIPMKILGFNLPGFYDLAVTNNTGQAWYDITVSIKPASADISINNNQEIKIAALLPFQTKRVPLTASTKKYTSTNLQPTSVELVGADNDQYETETVLISAGPAFIGTFKNPQLLVGLGVIGALLALIAGSLLVFRRK